MVSEEYDEMIPFNIFDLIKQTLSTCFLFNHFLFLWVKSIFLYLHFHSGPVKIGSRKVTESQAVVTIVTIWEEPSWNSSSG